MLSLLLLHRAAPPVACVLKASGGGGGGFFLRGEPSRCFGLRMGEAAERRGDKPGCALGKALGLTDRIFDEPVKQST